MPEAYIVEAVRSPVGKKRGGLSQVHSADLGAHSIKGLIERAGIDPAVVDDRVRSLGRRLNQILGLHFRSPGFHVSHHELATDRELNYLSPYDLEAGLAMLARRGLVVETKDKRFKSYGGRAWSVPHDLAETFLRSRRERKRGVFHSLTLRGWLERSYDRPGRRRQTPTRLRETYKMYSSPTAAVARVERLPEDLRQQEPAWSRRSRFEINHRSVMVSEVFLRDFRPWPGVLPVHRTQRGKVSAAIVRTKQ